MVRVVRGMVVCCYRDGAGWGEVRFKRWSGTRSLGVDWD